MSQSKLAFLVIAVVAVFGGFFFWQNSQSEASLEKKLCDFTPKNKIRAYEELSLITLYEECLGIDYDFIEETDLDTWYALNAWSGKPGNSLDMLKETGRCPDEGFVKTVFEISPNDLFPVPAVLRACDYYEELAQLSEILAPLEVDSYSGAISYLSLAIKNSKNPRANGTILSALISKGCSYEGTFETPREAYFKAMKDAIFCGKTLDTNSLMKIVRKSAESESPVEKGWGLALLRILQGEGPESIL